MSYRKKIQTSVKRRSSYEVWFDKHADSFLDFTSGEVVWKAAQDELRRRLKQKSVTNVKNNS